jgi:hypothetical protein
MKTTKKVKDIKDYFIPYELSVRLINMGFDKPCLFGYEHDSINFHKSSFIRTIRPGISDYHSVVTGAKMSHATITAILYQQALDWFDELGIYISDTWIKTKGTRTYKIVGINKVFNKMDSVILHAITMLEKEIKRQKNKR